MPAPLIYSAYDTQSTALIDARVLGLFSAAGPLTYSAITGQFSITNAAADGATKGAAAFTAADFNDNGAGLISLDYTNGQKATATQPGFLTSTDWGIFNGKQAPLTLPLSISNGGTNNAGEVVCVHVKICGDASLNHRETARTLNLFHIGNLAEGKTVANQGKKKQDSHDFDGE